MVAIAGCTGGLFRAVPGGFCGVRNRGACFMDRADRPFGGGLGSGPAGLGISKVAAPAQRNRPKRIAMRRSGSARRGITNAPAMPMAVGIEAQ